MRRQPNFVVAVAAWSLAVVPALGQTVQDALKVVPEKASGFVIVNNLGELDKKIESLARRLGMPLPASPLEMLKGELGIGNGINTKGSLLLALILEEGDQLRPIPLVYVPVADYAALLKGLGARGDGAIETVELPKRSKKMIVGRQGAFAVFTEPDGKEALQETLRSTPGIKAALAPVESRLSQNDITGVLTSRGIKQAAGKARAAMAMGFNPNQLPQEAQFLKAWFEGLDRFLKSVESDVTHVLVGSRLDKVGNLAVDGAALFASGSGFAQAGATAKPLPGQPLAGLPDIPYMVAFSGSMSGSLMKEMMNLSTKLMTALAADVPAEKMQKLEQVAGKIFKDLRGMSMVMGASTGKQSLFQSSYVVMKVADAQAYLKDYEDYMEAYNGFMKEIKLPVGFPNQSMKLTKTKVNGLPALEVIADLGLGDNQLEPVQKMMEIYFGPGGKMVVTSVAVDKDTLLVRYTPASEAKDFVKAYLDRSGGLASNKEIAQTTKLLPEGSQWTFFISPQGTVATVHRIVTAMMPQLGEPRLPDFPKTAPIGIGVKLSATGLEKRLVIPAAVLDSVGPFIRQIHAGGNVQ